LPLAAEVEAAAAVEAGATPCYRVLLVDDDPINRLAVGTLLRQQGYSVVEAQNGRIAIECLAAQAFDVVLMDVHMPEMDGVAATMAIRATADPRMASTAIIGLTASVMSNEQQRYLDAGMDAVAEKPVMRASLLRIIERCVTERVVVSSVEA
jgi:CheY-like chemotaxis protein